MCQIIQIMNDILEQKIADIARSDYRYLNLFIELKMDFFCKGNQSVKEAMKEASVEETIFIEKLKTCDNFVSTSYHVNIEEWPLDLLADYIQKTHHAFTEKCIAEIKALSSDIDFESSITIQTFRAEFDKLAKSLGAHMKKEELMLFPAIRKMYVPNQEPPKAEAAERIVGNMEHDHDEQFELLQNIRRLLTNYMPTQDDNFNKLLNAMKQLDVDLAHHLHLENNILFPNFVQLVLKTI